MGFTLRTPFVALFTIFALLSTVAVQGGDTAHAQVACTTSWTNAAGGDWNVDANWDNGSPDAGDDACITLNGTYLVFVRNFETVNSLQIGGTAGTQSLSVEARLCNSGSGTQLTLNNGGTIGERAAVTVTKVADVGCGGGTGEGAVLNVAGGTLVNEGSLATTPGAGGTGPHELKGNITNNGTVDIHVTTFFHEAGSNNSTFLNQGSLEIADTTRFDVAANEGTSFTNGTDGSIVPAGSGHVFVGAQNTYNQGAGTTTGTRPVVVQSGNIVYTGTGASSVFFRFFGNLSGNIGTNQDLTIEGANCTNTGTQLTANASFTNDGEVTLTRFGDAGCSNGVEDAILNIASGTMTNNGTLNTVTGTGGNGNHQLKGNITNNGTVDIGVDTFFHEAGSNNSTFLNQGSLYIADGTRFDVVANEGTWFTNGTGGSIDVAGAGHVFVGAQNNYNQGAGTALGLRPVVVQGGNINYTGAGASNVFFRFFGNLSGDIGADQDLTIEAVNCSNTGTELRAHASFTNNGDTTLTRFGDTSCFEGVGLAITSGTLTNQGTFTSEGTIGTGPSLLIGNLTNGSDGIIEVDRTLTLRGSGATHQNAGGLVDIGVNQTLVDESGAFTQTSGETALAGGTGGISAAASVSIQGGSLRGTGTISPGLTNSGGVVAPGGSPGLLNVNGPLTQGAGGTLEMEIEGDMPDTGHDKLAITGAASLSGTLDLCTGSSFTPDLSDRFQILSHASRTGTFATVNGTSAPGGNQYVVDYDTTETALDVAAGSSGSPELCEGAPFQITSMTPDEGGAACCTTVVVHGVRIEPGAELTLSRTGEADIEASGIDVADDGRSLSGKFDLTGAELGPWNVTVTNPDAASSPLPDGFTIEEVSTPDLWVAIDGPRTVRPNRVWNGYLAFGNKGNVDARGVEIQFSQIPPFNEITLGPTSPPAVISEDVSDDQTVKYYAEKVAPGTTQFVPLRIVFVEEGEHELEARMLEGVFDPDAVLPLDPDIEAEMEIQEAIDPSGSSPGSLRGVLHVTGSVVGDIDFDYEVVETTGHEDPEVGVTETSPGQKRYTLRATYESEGTIYLVEGSLEGSENAFDGLTRAGTYSGSASFASRRAPGSSRGVRELLQVIPPNPLAVNAAHGHQEQELSRANLVDCLFDKGILNGDQAAVLNEINEASSKWGLVSGFSFVAQGLAGLVGLVAMGGSGTADSDFETQLKIYLRGAGYDIPQEVGSNEMAMEIAKAICHADDLKFSGFAVKNVLVTNSFDPNEKVGPEGSGEERYIEGDDPLPYTIKFENLETATAPAQDVTITDALDSDLDPSTLSLGPISFGDTYVAPPPGLSSWTTDIDLRPANDLIVRVDVELEGGVITWNLRSLDPITMKPTSDPAAGFLPPNDNPPEGEGSVSFSVLPDEGLQTGSEIQNSASIVFDLNPPIVTNSWTNTLDHDAPSSSVDSIGSSPGCALNVEWSGSDLGSGIRHFDVYVSEDGGEFELWRFETQATTGTYQGSHGHIYGFFSVARDGAGHRETPPPGADASRLAACGVPGGGGSGGTPSPTPSTTTSPSPSPSVPRDRDLDGTPDIEDACPDTPGPLENDGCPLPPPECGSPLVDVCGTPGNDIVNVGSDDDANGDGTVLVSLGEGDDIACLRAVGPLLVIIRGGPGDDDLIADGSGACAASGKSFSALQRSLEALLAVVERAATNVKLLGGDGRDRLIGNAAANLLKGGRGKDAAAGRAGDDIVRGGRGTDRLRGERGDDHLFGGGGRDSCRGGKGTDRVHSCE